jgi:hypothetical protein
MSCTYQKDMGMSDLLSDTGGVCQALPLWKKLFKISEQIGKITFEIQF